MSTNPKIVNNPRILLADTNRWALSSRLAIALSQTGFEVFAVCASPKHPLQKTRAVKQTFPYRGFGPLSSLESAITAVKPDLIIPCCDRSVGHLHELHLAAQRSDNRILQEMIERSLGAPASYAVVDSRYELLRIAGEEGVRVPQTHRVEHPERLLSQSFEFLPSVLKASGTWGGGGVRVIRRTDEMQTALGQLNQLFRSKRAFKRLMVNRDSFWLYSWWNNQKHELILQSYIEGRAANSAVVCWKGQVLAGISVEVSECDGATGPARVVRVVNNPEMLSAAVRIASRLQLSGLFGLDFVIQDETNAAYLIEMNPRPTPLSHFRLGRGRDIVGALAAQMGLRECEAPAVTDKEMIAYFPQQRGTSPELLAKSFLDCPENEPELVKELRNPWPDRTLLFRLSTWMNRRRSGLPQERVSNPRLELTPTEARSGSHRGIPLT